MKCKWLPTLMLYDDYDSWNSYQDALYKVFCHDFKETHPMFNGKKVVYRRHPIEYGREEAFYHVTCQAYSGDDERVPDFRRCERIKWIRKFIENFNCNLEECEECSGIKAWEEDYKGNSRIHILLEEEKYMVVIEKRENYCLLITAFYIEHNHTLRKKLKKYQTYKAKNASSK